MIPIQWSFNFPHTFEKPFEFFPKSRRVSVQFPHFRWANEQMTLLSKPWKHVCQKWLGLIWIFVCYPLLKPETNSFAHENRAETQKRWQNLPFGPIFQGRAGWGSGSVFHVANLNHEVFILLLCSKKIEHLSHPYAGYRLRFHFYFFLEYSSLFR